jgi:hypothetical protein
MSENAFPIAITIALTCLLCWVRTLILRIGKGRYSQASTNVSRQVTSSAPLAGRWAIRPWTLAVQARRSRGLRVVSEQSGEKRTSS